MPELTEKLARVESTWLGTEDHGIFTAVLQLDYGTAQQGAGSYDLRHSDAAARFIAGVLSVAKVESWEKVPGTTLYALIDNGGAGLVRGLRSLPFFGKQVDFRFDSIYEDADQ
jgi:hypothetical protein